MDISIILGNGLMNAIEAAAATKGEVSVSFRYNEAVGWLVMTIVNPVSKTAELTQGERWFRSTKKEAGHGFGLENMEDSARLYDGHIRSRLGDGQFTLDVMLQKPEKFPDDSTGRK